MTDQQKEKLMRLFLRLTKSKGFLGIEEIVARLDAGDFWTDDFLEKAVFEAKKSYARGMARAVKDKDGNRVFHSIEQINSEGETQRVYKQEVLFNVEDYKQAAAYHMDRASHHMNEAKRMQQTCSERCGVQFDLPYKADAPSKRAEKRKDTKRGKRTPPEAAV